MSTGNPCDKPHDHPAHYWSPEAAHVPWSRLLYCSGRPSEV